MSSVHAAMRCNLKVHVQRECQIHSIHYENDQKKWLDMKSFSLSIEGSQPAIMKFSPFAVLGGMFLK